VQLQMQFFGLKYLKLTWLHYSRSLPANWFIAWNSLHTCAFPNINS